MWTHFHQSIDGLDTEFNLHSSNKPNEHQFAPQDDPFISVVAWITRHTHTALVIQSKFKRFKQEHQHVSVCVYVYGLNVETCKCFTIVKRSIHLFNWFWWIERLVGISFIVRKWTLIDILNVLRTLVLGIEIVSVSSLSASNKIICSWIVCLWIERCHHI